MKATSILALLFGGMLATLTVCADSTDLDGRELVVRVYNKPDPRGPDFKTVSATINASTIEFHDPDANDATTFAVSPSDQKGRWFRETFGDSYHKWPFAEGPPYYLPIPLARLEDRPVIVRVYKNTLEAPAVYEQATVPVKARNIRFDFGKLHRSAFVGIFGEDQTDDVIRMAFGNTFYAWPYAEGLYFDTPQKIVVEKQTTDDWTFFDALGNIVQRAEVEIWLTARGGRVFLGTETLDEEGRLFIDKHKGYDNAWTNHSVSSAGYRFVVSHSKYGKSALEPDRSRASGEVFIPSVPPGSAADRRSAWGVVVDPNGQAVKDAFVKGLGLIPAGAKWVGDILGQRHGVMTDQQGRFRMYLPPAEDAIQIGTLIPLKTQYAIEIEPARDSNLSEFKGRIINGLPTTIVLKFRQEYFRTFAFEDENGPITDPKHLERIWITIERKDQPSLYLHYEKFRDGGQFPLGTYEAELSAGRTLKFQPLQVTEDSPSQLVFRLGQAQRYYGRVLHGVTGEPVAAATVKAGDEKITLDPNGLFEIELSPKTGAGGFVVSAAHHLTVNVPKRWAKRDNNGGYGLGQIKLFPAATINVEPVVQAATKYRTLLFRPKWFLVERYNPAWVWDLLAQCEEHPEKGILREFEIEPNQRNSFPVPAGVPLRINLRVRHGIEWAPTTIADYVKLKQGQVYDAGRHEIVEPFKIFVEVTNSVGNHVEGVPVVVCGGHDPAISSTGENGFAYFDFVGYSKGDFIIECKATDDPKSPHLRQTIPYHVAGPQDANTVYTLQISDEMLEALFK